jgi:3D (Asp-Asp-Asp) domain-containing protein
MLISNSFWRRGVATVGAAVGLVFLYETTIRDSRYAARQAMGAETAVVEAGSQLQFQATAYCKGETTASGARVRTGIAAADPLLLPVGTVVRVDMPNPRYSGIWTIMDTGPAVQGRTIDLYLWSCYEALDFGRRPVRVTVLRLGWNPRNSTPGVVESLFRERETARDANPPPKWVRPAPGAAVESHPEGEPDVVPVANPTVEQEEVVAPVVPAEHQGEALPDAVAAVAVPPTTR